MTARQHRKVYAHDLNVFEIMSNLKINFHERPQSFTENVSLSVPFWKQLICLNHGKVQE